jgi:3alpha(or 20beta)-hydroxysteroid dehydrogenase
MGRLDNKVALITGGARGQGEQEARLFAAEGATVYLTDILDDEGRKVASDIGGTYLTHDVTDEARWAEVVTSIISSSGKIDVLVNNAGIFIPKVLTATSTDVWSRTVAVNQTGVFFGMRAVAPHMIEQKGGSIINISSIAGLRGSSAAFAYGATKWAVRGMTKSAAKELAPHGVRVNSIHPGIIDTPMLRALDDVEARENVRRRIPMGHEAGPAEVANLALYLASDDSRYSTGSEFIIDGGMTA